MPLSTARFSQNDRLRKASENAPPLKSGERGEGVAIVQLALIDLGFRMRNSTAGGAALPDGIFGPETQSTVIAFQRANGLAPDGIVGRLTLTALERAIIAITAAQAAADSANSRGRANQHASASAHRLSQPAGARS